MGSEGRRFIGYKEGLEGGVKGACYVSGVHYWVVWFVLSVLCSNLDFCCAS